MNSQPVALITAASRGMGAACAEELSRRGYRVSLLARSPEVVELGESLGGLGTVGSVGSPEDLQTVVNRTDETFGRIDAVVNNTGHPAKGPLLEISDEEWHQGLDLLLLNVVRMARLVVPIMEREAGGSIVNVSAFGAVEPSPFFPVSSSIRAAVSNFTKLFADAYAEAGIRMNTILPGFIETYPIDDTVRAAIPTGRAGRLSEIAKTVAFLVSTDAGYITGQSVRVDGGMTRGY